MAEATARTELLDQIEAAHKELESHVLALRNASLSNVDSEVIQRGQAQLLRLSALRGQLTGGAAGISLGALRAEITAAVAETRAYTADTSAGAISTGTATANILSIAEYQRATAAWDKRIAQSYEREALHLAYARDIAQRLGIDISGYEQERLGLEAERDAARRRGDKLGERRADALIAQNTYNTLAGELDRITDPAERERHIEQMRAQQRIVAERRAALEAQIALEARRTAAQLGLSPAEAATFVADSKKQKMAEYDERAHALKGASGAVGAQAQLEAAVRAGVPQPAVADANAPIHPMAAALTPDAVAKAREVGARINAARDTGIDSLDAASLPPAMPSAIALATSPNAHKTVETPKTAASNGAAKPSLSL